MAEDGVEQKPKKKRHITLSRDIVIKRLNRRHGQKKPSPMVQLQEIFEEAEDKGRFVGDTMFWKYFEDIEISRIYHTNSVEFMNLKVMFYETLFFCVLIVFFTVYVNVMQSRDVFDARQEQEDYWSGCDSFGVCSIDQVDSVDSFWHFMREDLVDRAFTVYADPPPHVADILTSFSGNTFPITWHPRYVGPQKSNVILGTIRLRQLRVTPNKGCQVSKLFSHLFPDCYGMYEHSAASQRKYFPRFAPSYLEDCFVYQTEEETLQYSMWGRLGTYGGDGYVVDMPWNNSDSRTLLDDLRHWEWQDKATRAVVVELTALNTNVNVVTNTRLLFEFGPTGSVAGIARSISAPVSMFTTATGTSATLTIFAMQFVLLGLFLLFTVYSGMLLYKTVRNFVGDSPLKFWTRQSLWGKIAFFGHSAYHYLRYSWNVVDLLMICIFFSHIGLRFGLYGAVTSSQNLAPDSIGHPELFMPFSTIMAPLVSCNQCLAILALLVWSKSFKYLCMCSYFRVLVRILEGCVVKLVVFSCLLVCVFFGFSVAFFIGMGANEENYAWLSSSFLVGFFLLIDGYSVNINWFTPGADWIMPMVFLIYIALIYFVLMNISVAVVLDTYATADRTVKEDPDRKNPMIVFLYTYYKSCLGISLVRDDAEENMKSEELSIPLELLPGVVRRKWIEKKRKMQRIANESFAGMEIYSGDPYEQANTNSDWVLPSSRLDVFDTMDSTATKSPLELYNVQKDIGKSEISRAQLQRLMNEDDSLPILLHEKKAENVIRRFKHLDERELLEGEEYVSPVKKLQGQVFGEVDALERVKLDEDIPEVPEISELTEEMSDAITTVRNQFRIQLTGIIEATAVLFEHLVEVTQGLDVVRDNNEGVIDAIREAAERELMRNLNKNMVKR